MNIYTVWNRMNLRNDFVEAVRREGFLTVLGDSFANLSKSKWFLDRFGSFSCKPVKITEGS